MSTDLDLKAIKAIIPHRYPILLLDRARIITKDVKIEGWKCVTNTEPFLQGHFPQEPIMPGVLQVEAMAQLASVLAGYEAEDTDALMLLASVNKARFSRKVIPGMCMHIHAEITAQRQNIRKFACYIEVDGQKASEAEIVGALA
ncbi:MAG: 3-hydroxyacyl-ACP dehydratase FabZ [Alphaproteobacteria bacterium]|nr:3-hydroxyacyl-ACP dehydratase FabZ [Alphaproteobacteria bacterium]